MESKHKIHRTYFPNLDGLRFFAFLSVFISHSVIFLGYQNNSPLFTALKNTFLKHGDLGVNFFFVLSGFLITYLLLQEKSHMGTIKLRHFYMRRILRIWPVYFLTLIVGFFVIPPLLANFDIHLPFITTAPIDRLPWYLFFAANIDMSFHMAPSVIVAVLWSISVEEQFYLIWPVLMKKISKKTIGVAILIIILISLLFRFFVTDNYDISKYFTFSVMSDLAVGAGLAYCVYYMSFIQDRLKKMSKFSIAFIYFFLFLLVSFKGNLGNLLSGFSYKIVYALLPLAFSLLFAFIIAEQNYAENSLWKIGRHKMVTSLGKVSYGLYAYHMISIFLVLLLFSSFGVLYPYSGWSIYILITVASFIGTILISFLSFRYIESKFLKHKERFSYKRENDVFTM